MNEKKTDEMITAGKAAKILGVDITTVRRWVDNGKLRGKRHPVNRYRMIRVSDVVKMAEKIGAVQR